MNDVELTVGGISLPVAYAGEQNQYLGLDQINAGPLPVELVGRGTANVTVRVGSAISNTLQVLLQ